MITKRNTGDLTVVFKTLPTCEFTMKKIFQHISLHFTLNFYVLVEAINAFGNRIIADLKAAEPRESTKTKIIKFTFQTKQFTLHVKNCSS